MKSLFLLTALFSISFNTLFVECDPCVKYVNDQLTNRNYKTMPGGLFSYSDYVTNLTPTQPAPAVNYVGYCKAFNTKTLKWDHATLGHVFIINKVNADGSLEISEGNISPTQCTRTITIKPSQRGTVKYWQPTKK
jgi:surface antigen